MRTSLHRPTAEGLSKLAASFGAYPYYEGQGRDAATKDYSSVVKAFADARKNNATAALDEERLNRQPVGRQNFMGAQTNLTNPQLSTVAQYFDAGRWPEVENRVMEPLSDGTVPMIPGVQPEWYNDQVAQKYNNARSAVALNDMATGDSNANQVAQAFREGVNANVQQNALGNNPTMSEIAQVMAAMKGEGAYSTTGTGITTNEFNGDTITSAFDRANDLDSQTKLAQEVIKGQYATTKGVRDPAQVAFIKFLQKNGKSFDDALSIATSKKNDSIRDMFMEAYLGALENAQFNGVDDPETAAEQAALGAIKAMSRNSSAFGGQAAPDPLGIR